MLFLFRFFSLTFIFSWSCWFAALKFPAERSALVLLGVFAPAIVAVSLTALLNGKIGLHVLLERMLHWQVRAKWYIFAIGYFAAVKLAAAVVYRITAGAWPQFGHEGWYVIAFAIVLSTPSQSGEEIGWRGYALPRLSAHFGLGSASLLLGVIWALWHLPFFIWLPGPQYGQSFPIYALSVIAISVAMAWLYANTNGSLLLVMLMHSAINQTIGIVPAAVPAAAHPFALSPSHVAWLAVLLLWIAAAYFLLRMRRLPGGTAEKNSAQNPPQMLA